MAPVLDAEVSSRRGAGYSRRGPALGKGEIREQLERILASPDFASSEKLRRFLTFIVEESLAGRAERLKGYIVGVGAFGRGSDFDPRDDPLVRNHAGRLRRALEHYYLTRGLADPVVIEVPKGGYRPLFSRSGTGTDRVAARPEESAAAAGPILALCGRPAIAVLPFAHLNGELQDQYFADGLTEELIVQLARFQELRVLGQHTSLWLGDPVKAARGLGARYLVRGSVRRGEETVRVAVHLIDSRDGTELWTESYDRELSAGNLLEVQDAISACVAARLVDAHGAIPRILSKEVRHRNSREMAAYEAVLRYYHYEARLTDTSFVKAMEALEQAVEADPDDALVLALLSYHYIDDDKLMHLTVEDSLAKAWELARRAVYLEPELQRTQFAVAYNHLHRREFGRFMKHAERTLELNPNSAFHVGVTGWAMALSGEWERGLAVMAKGIELNPRHPGWFHLAPCLSHLRQDRLEEALADARAFNIPELPWDPALRASLLGHMGREEEARAALGELLALDSKFPGHARRYLSGYIFQDELVDQVVEGLERAGLPQDRPGRRPERRS